MELATELKRRQDTSQLKRYAPYAKQKAFHTAGGEHTERLFMAGNQEGKTWAGGAEWAMHLTGRYPDWWKGKTFESPVDFWASGKTNVAVRDTVQKMLLGPPAEREQWGTGMIPKDAIVDHSLARGTADMIDTLIVRYGGGGDIQGDTSSLWLKTYDQGRQKWQGATLHGVWFDEEPPMDIYSEGRTRTQANGTFTMMTFTPLLGMSEVVSSFLLDDATLGDVDKIRKATEDIA